MRLQRFRIRTMIVLVFATAALIWGAIMLRRSNEAFDRVHKFRLRGILEAHRTGLAAGYLEGVESQIREAEKHIKIIESLAEKGDEVKTRMYRGRVYEYQKNLESYTEARARYLQRRDLLTVRVLHFVNLMEKYERAGRYPWLPIGPDPPAPPESE